MWKGRLSERCTVGRLVCTAALVSDAEENLRYKRIFKIEWQQICSARSDGKYTEKPNQSDLTFSIWRASSRRDKCKVVAKTQAQKISSGGKEDQFFPSTQIRLSLSLWVRRRKCKKLRRRKREFWRRATFRGGASVGVIFTVTSINSATHAASTSTGFLGYFECCRFKTGRTDSQFFIVMVIVIIIIVIMIMLINDSRGVVQLCA